MKTMNKAQTIFLSIVGALFFIIFAGWAILEVKGSRKIENFDISVASMKLDLPKAIRQGSSDEIRLEISTDKKQLATWLTAPDANVMLAARLDLEGALAFPNGITTQPVTDGNKFRFYWRVENDHVVPVRGVLWLWASAVSDDGGTLEKVPLANVPIEISSVDPLSSDFGWVLVLTVVVAFMGGFYFLQAA